MEPSELMRVDDDKIPLGLDILNDSVDAIDWEANRDSFDKNS